MVMESVVMMMESGDCDGVCGERCGWGIAVAGVGRGLNVYQILRSSYHQPA